MVEAAITLERRSSLVWIMPHSELAEARASSLPQMIGLQVPGHQTRAVSAGKVRAQAWGLPIDQPTKAVLVGHPQVVGSTTVGWSADSWWVGTAGDEECPWRFGPKSTVPYTAGRYKLKENQIEEDDGYCHRRDPVCERVTRCRWFYH